MPRPKTPQEINKQISTLEEFIKAKKDFEKQAILQSPEVVKNAQGDTVKDYRRYLSKYYKEQLDEAQTPTIATVVQQQTRADFAKKINQPIIEQLQKGRQRTTAQAAPVAPNTTQQPPAYANIAWNPMTDVFYQKVQAVNGKTVAAARIETGDIFYGKLKVLKTLNPKQLQIGNEYVLLTPGIEAILLGQSGYSDDDILDFYTIAKAAGIFYQKGSDYKLTQSPNPIMKAFKDIIIEERREQAMEQAKYIASQPSSSAAPPPPPLTTLPSTSKGTPPPPPPPLQMGSQKVAKTRPTNFNPLKPLAEQSKLIQNSITAETDANGMTSYYFNNQGDKELYYRVYPNKTVEKFREDGGRESVETEEQRAQKTASANKNNMMGDLNAKIAARKAKLEQEESGNSPSASYPTAQAPTVGNGMRSKKLKSKAKRYYFTNTQDVRDRLNLIIGAVRAGNTSVDMRNEGNALIDYLVKSKEISKPNYNKLAKMLI